VKGTGPIITKGRRGQVLPVLHHRGPAEQDRLTSEGQGL